MRAISVLLIAGCALMPWSLAAQDRMATRTGHIEFHSATPLEDILAVNRRVASVYVPSTGAVEFSALIKAFEFKKAMMQEHFNENYMESGTFPKAVFKGRVSTALGDSVQLTGTHQVTVEGELSMHGVSRQITVQGTMTTAADGTIEAQSSFEVRPEDYGIEIPGVVREKIAKLVQVSVLMVYKPL